MSALAKRIREILDLDGPAHARHNLDAAYADIDRHGVDDVCMKTLSRVRSQLREIEQILDSAPDNEGGWRPIETASKDGTFVLVAMKSGFVCILQYCTDRYWRPNAYDTFKDRKPTHYMPLPAPPSQERKP